MTMGSAKAANSPSLKSLQDKKSEPTGGEAATDQIPSTDDAPEDRAGEGRMEGASRADNLAEIDFRKMADPDQIEQAHEVAARLAKTMRTRLTRLDLARHRGYRLDLRLTIPPNISPGRAPIPLVNPHRNANPPTLSIPPHTSGSPTF